MPPGMDQDAQGDSDAGAQSKYDGRKRGLAWAAGTHFSRKERGTNGNDFKRDGGVQDLIFALPALDVPPRSDEGTNAVISRIVSHLDDIGQQSCLVFCDGVEYADLAAKVHSNDRVSKRIVLAFGGFLLCQAAMGALGTIFKTAGLQSLIEDAGVLGESTCEQALKCGH